MGEHSTRDILSVPLFLCGVMLAVGFASSRAAGIDGSGLVIPYLSASLAVTFLSLLIAIFWWTTELALNRVDDPLPRIVAKISARAPILVLPGVVFPLFLVGFTTSKTAIPFLVGYRWDAFWAEADYVIFGQDAWRITHRLFASWSMPMWEWVYTVAWGFILIFCKAFVALLAAPKRVMIFYTAMLLTWLLGGWLMAYGFSTAGPVFVHLFDPDLGSRFEELRWTLDASLSPDGAIRGTQTYLAGAIDNSIAVRGGGISAMPSMHLAAASIYIFAAWRTKWALPACVFWVVIFVASAHFGYHYWVDGIVAFAVAFLCWQAAEYYFQPHPRQSGLAIGAV